MKQFALVLAFVATAAYGDCHIRTNLTLKLPEVNTPPTDVQRMVSSTPRGFKCNAQYRVHVGNEWKTVEGTGTGATETQACADAVDVSRGTLLAEVAPRAIKSTNQMVCTDFPDIRVRPVKIGEIVWESETDLHAVPAERPYFKYKNTVCRMFAERDAQTQNLAIYQGIICRLNATPYSQWKVIDKY